MRPLFLFLILFCFTSCSSQTDGIYCAEVDYYNSRTMKESHYTLTAEVLNGKLIQLNFPSGGHIDEEDFGMAKFDDNNTTVARLEGGKNYKITLTQKGTDCFNNVPRAKQCQGTTTKGRRCKNMTDNPSGFCHWHG